jgi:hypothetical protein
MTSGTASDGVRWLLAICLAGPCLLLGIPVSRPAAAMFAPQDPEPPVEQEPPVETPPAPEETPAPKPEGQDEKPTEEPPQPKPEERSADGKVQEKAEGTAQEPAKEAGGQQDEKKGESPPKPEPSLGGPPERASTPADAAPDATEPPAAVAPEPEGQPEPEAETAAAVALPPFQPSYRSMADVARTLVRFAEAAPGVATTFELGRTQDGRPVHGIELGLPGAVPLAERPTIFLFGGLDGRSLAGGEAVLDVVHSLLADSATLPQDVAVVAVPWVSGQALSALADASGTAPSRDGRNGRPLDDDRDGRVDEDGPDDLDGDGLILDMLIEDPRGPWVRGGDGRFLVPAGPGDGTRYLWTREGRDDDGDGRFNEDPPGGVVLDRNFPVHRTGPWDDPRCGEVPMSEPLVRAVADLVLARRAAVVLLMQGNHGYVATPGGLALDTKGAFDAADRPVFERVTEAFLAATGRSQPGIRTLRQARGEVSAGAALDWLHAVTGALSLEVAPWGPEVEATNNVAARDARYATPENAALQKPRSLDGRPHLGDIEGAWARWLDNTKGGLGFIEWQPVELGGGFQGWVGGWEPRTILNPPVESLPRALEGLAEFVRELAVGLPRLEVRVTQSEREGDLVRLRAQVRNLGRLPTGMTRRGAPGVELSVEIPTGAQILAGEPTVDLPRLLGGELSAEVAWVVLAPEGSVVGLRADAGWTLPAVREVRP